MGAARPHHPRTRERACVRAIRSLRAVSPFCGLSLDQLLDRFAELRRDNLATVRGWRLTEAQLDLPGRHPELGAVDLRQLLATWAVHDLNHLAQVSRVMAKRYADDVGVWRAYLSILNR